MKLCKHTSRIVAIFVPLAICLSALLTSSTKAATERLRLNSLFVAHPIAETMYLYDVGVADLNNDAWLDIFTNNHQVRPMILINQQGNMFKDHTLALNLGNAMHHAESEPSLDRWQPKLDRPGLYIYWHLGDLVVRTHRLSESGSVQGVLLVRSSEKPASNGPVVVTEGPVDEAIALQFPKEMLVDTEKAITFVATGDATLVVRSFRGYYSPRIKIKQTLPLDDIFIGVGRKSPASYTFRLASRDRHAMAWFDVDGDAAIDVVAADGGQGGRRVGRVGRGSGSFKVLLQRDGRFEETLRYRELSSYGCSSRQVSLADYDADHDLDMYFVCGLLEGVDQLFERTASGAYEEVSAASGLDIVGGGLATWLDVDGDGDLDLFRTADNKAWLWRNLSGHFGAELIGALTGRAMQLSKADYDGDGDTDIYLAAETRSTLLIGERGSLEIADPERIGLPREAVCGNWVDHNNDGLQDLHVLPGGIFEQRSGGRFYSTDLLSSADPPNSAHCIWFDSNNDGYRDLVVAVPKKATLLERLRTGIGRWIGTDWQVWISENPYLYFFQWITMGHPFFRPEIWELTLYRAVGGDRHWLEVGLTGSKENPPAIGASVRLRTALATQVQAVGHAEGSLRSSGHYRVYFGLGDDAQIGSVQVAWPDGSLQEVDGVTSDRLLTIQRERQD
jgi:hypothetical protein